MKPNSTSHPPSVGRAFPGNVGLAFVAVEGHQKPKPKLSSWRVEVRVPGTLAAIWLELELETLQWRHLIPLSEQGDGRLIPSGNFIIY